MVFDLPRFATVYLQCLPLSSHGLLPVPVPGSEFPSSGRITSPIELEAFPTPVRLGDSHPIS